MNRPVFILLGVIASLVLSCGSDDSLNGEVRISSTAHLYASTANGIVKRYDINDAGKITSFNSMSTYVNSIQLDEDNDSFVLLSGSNKRLEEYPGVSDYGNGGSHDLENAVFGSADLENPVDLAINNGFYVVSDSTDLDGDLETTEGRLFVYRKSEDSFVLRNVVTTRFRVSGLEFIDKDLYVGVDGSNRIALFSDFVAANPLNRIVTATKIISLQGMVSVRAMDHKDGLLIVSDLGEMDVEGDGAFHIIEDFAERFANTSTGGFIPADVQQRVSGANTKLGDPVEVDYDPEYNVIFVAESLSGGGRVLAFNKARDLKGNIAPDLTYELPGVTSLYYYTE